MSSKNLFNQSVRSLFILIAIIFYAHAGKAQMRQIYLDNVADNELYKLDFYSPSEGYVAFRDWVGYTTDSGRTYTKKYITTSNVNYNGYSVNLTFGFGISGVKSFNQNTIIVYGDYGLVPAILYSTNGGSSYTLIYHSQYNPFQFSTGITDMIFPQNGSIGYAVDADRILKTTNQGLTWSTVRIDPGSFFNHLEAVDNNFILAMNTDYSNNKLLKSTNAGASWQTVTLPYTYNTKLQYAYFMSTTKGWVSMRNGNNEELFYSTNDGGNNWNLLNDPIATPISLGKFKFVDANTAYGLGGVLQNTVSKTLNGGVTWEPLPRDNNYTYLGYTHNDLQCISSTQLWAGGGHGFLELSTNGGGTPLPRAYFKIDTVGFYPSDKINLINFSRTSYSCKWYVNSNLISTNYNTTYTHIWPALTDTVKLVVTSGTQTDTLQRIQYYNVPDFAQLSSFFPATGSKGTFVTLTGTGLTSVTAVKFGGVSASSFTIVDANTITAIVNTGATGAVSVTDSHGVSSKPGFTYFAVPSTNAPLITVVDPPSAVVGTPVTITGSNFAANVADNIVYFGATQASVQSASTTQLTCTVPAGATFNRVSVLNKVNNQSGESPQPFIVLFEDSSSFTTTSFPKVLQLSFANNNSLSSAIGRDIDGDGKPDLLIYHRTYYIDSISIMRNTSTINNFSFEPRKNISSIGSGYGSGIFCTGDIDNDGKPDVVSSTNSGKIVVVRNTSTPGNILFDPSVVISGVGGTWDVAVADLDNDGKNDIVSASAGGSLHLSVIRNTSSPGYLSFGAVNSFNCGGSSMRVSVGDVDGDGKKDIVTLDFLNNDLSHSNISYFKNTSTQGVISLAPRFDIQAQGPCLQGNVIQIVDYDGDGKNDIVIIDDDVYAIYRNIGTIGNAIFDSPVMAVLGGTGQGGTVSSLSGNSKPDIISGNWSIGRFTLVNNTSTPGNISNDIGVNVGAAYPIFTNCVDLNLDGKEDIICTNAGIREVAIYKNNVGGAITYAVCEGVNGSINSDVTGTTYQWQQETAPGVFTDLVNTANIYGVQTNQLVFANISFALNGVKFRCHVNNTSYSSKFMIVVKKVLSATISITTSSSPVCYGSPATFTATTTGGNGIAKSYQWLINGTNAGTNSATFTSSTINNNDKITCKLTDLDSCSNQHFYLSNEIVMSVTGGLNFVSISTPTTGICIGTAVTFTATPVSNPPGATYTWKVNGTTVAGATNTTFTTSTLTNNATVQCLQWLTPTCSSPSNIITMQVNSTPVTPTIVISSSATTICAGTLVTFTAAATNTGNPPTYEWKINGVTSGTNSPTFFSYSLNNNDVVTCTLTSNATCVTSPTANSNSITMSVAAAPFPPTINIAASSTTICAGTAVVFTATTTNGGSSPIYKWKLNGNNVGTNSSTFTSSTLSNGDVVSAVLTSNASCASTSTANSNNITMTVNSVTTSVNIAASSLNICSGENIVFTATPVNGGSIPAYQWKKNGTVVGTNSNTFSSNTLINGDVITVDMTSNATCAPTTPVTSAALTVKVNAASSAHISISGITRVFTGLPTAISSSVQNAGAAATYQWQDSTQNHSWKNISTATLNSFNYLPITTGDKLRCLLSYSNPCTSSTVAVSNVLSFIVDTANANGNPYLINAHPNPVHNILTVDRLRLASKWQTLEIISSNGSKVLVRNDIAGQTSVKVEVSGLAPGFYFILLTNWYGENQFFKFIKL